MKYLFFSFFLLNFARTYSQSLNFNFFKMTPNDMGSLSVYDDKTKIITTYIQKSDSLILVKKYDAFKNKCFHTYELDNSGKMNGYNKFLDTVSKTTTYSYLTKNQLNYSYKINEKGDTISSEVKINDSTYTHKEINTSKNYREEWISDEKGIKTGFYYTYNLQTNHLIEKSQFIKIYSNQITNRDLFRKQKIKYNLGSLISEKESIPISKIIYNEKGKIDSKTIYKWDCVKF